MTLANFIVAAGTFRLPQTQNLEQRTDKHKVDTVIETDNLNDLKQLC